ncbi:DPP IV N-terminal domain-containing protein [Sphingomonas cavernae]|nr:DPP IV N-terminal domain-containing protein [Sphingomonas cavernae]
MNKIDAEITAMTLRYERAANRDAMRSTRLTPNNNLSGYWIDNQRFFYSSEHFDADLDRVISTPMIADMSSGSAGPIMPLEQLAIELTKHSEAPIEVAAFADAEYDMPNDSQLVVTLNGTAFRLDIATKSASSAEPLSTDPELFSPDGQFACFVQGNDLWLRDRVTGETRELTNDGAPYLAYGQQSECCLGMVSYRKHPVPVAIWSPDSQWLLTHRIDDREVPDLPLVQHASPDSLRPVLHTYKYATMGDPSPIATFVAIHIPTGRIVEATDFPAIVFAFSPIAMRLAWFGDDGATCYFIRSNIYQTETDLVELNLDTGKSRIVVSEKAEQGYLDLHALVAAQINVRPLASSNELIWYSQRDGWGHLYLYDAATGALKNQITQGDWIVRDIIHVDEGKRRILFLAGCMDMETDPGNRRLCSVNFDGSDLRVVIADSCDVMISPRSLSGHDQEKPFHPSYARTGASADGRYVVRKLSRIDQGSRIDILDLEGNARLALASVDTELFGEWTPPRPFKALAADNETMLYGTMFLPTDFEEGQHYPIIDYIYPGPQIAYAPRHFETIFASQARMLAELGFVVLMLDSRSVPLRSRAFHHAGYGHLLEPQLADHVAVIEQLCKRNAFMDRSRVGMIGQSGGGYATARALFDYPDMFKVGVSVCGNHDSRAYAQLWLSKYGGPGSESSWEAQSNQSAAKKLQGDLLLVSGDMDENVHVGHTLSLANALVQANRDFDLLIVPNAGHGVLLTDAYTQRRVWDYFVSRLAGLRHPKNFPLEYRPADTARIWKLYAQECRG